MSGLSPRLAALVRERNPNERAWLATRVQAELDAAKKGERVAREQFARFAQRHEKLLSGLIEAGIDNLTVLGGEDLPLSALSLDDLKEEAQ